MIMMPKQRLFGFFNPSAAYLFGEHNLDEG